MKKLSKAEEKKQLILKHAHQVILEDGFEALTLDAVVKHAGISKGGLLYHFSHRDDLIRALGLYAVEVFYEELRRYVEDDDGIGKWCRGYINASFADLEKNKNLYVGLMSHAALGQPDSDEIDAIWRRMNEKMEQDGLDITLVDLIRLVIDGLYHRVLAAEEELSQERLKSVYERLMGQTYDKAE